MLSHGHLAPDSADLRAGAGPYAWCLVEQLPEVVRSMATFSTSAEVLMPEHPLMKLGRRMNRTPGIALADILMQAGGAYETTTPLSEEFRGYIREVADLTSDAELLRIAELHEVPVSLENCRQVDPQTRVAVLCRLDVSPSETPRWRRIPPGGIPATPRSDLDEVLRRCRGARIEELALPDGRHWRHIGPAGLPAWPSR
jgi:hypothetical protein